MSSSKSDVTRRDAIRFWCGHTSAALGGEPGASATGGRSACRGQLVAGRDEAGTLEAAGAREVRDVAARAPAQLVCAQRVLRGAFGLRVAVVVDACAQRAGLLAAALNGSEAEAEEEEEAGRQSDGDGEERTAARVVEAAPRAVRRVERGASGRWRTATATEAELAGHVQPAPERPLPRAARRQCLRHRIRRQLVARRSLLVVAVLLNLFNRHNNQPLAITMY